MNIVIYQNPEDYLAEFTRVRAALVAKGTSLRKWTQAEGLDYHLALRALKGQSYGRQAIELRRHILSEILSKAA
jgi:hypothetical protein